MRLGQRLGLGFPGGGELAQAAYNGSRYYRNDSGVFLKDFGHGDSNDDAKLYSGQALDFDGVDDYIDTPCELVDGDDYTLAVTFNTDDITNNDQRIIDCYYGANGIVSTSGDKIRAWVLGAGDVSYNLYSEALLSNTIYRAVFSVTSAGVCSFYINGSLVDSTTMAEGTSRLNGNPFEISNSSHCFNGQISNVQIWNKAFTADDVAFDYANLHHMKPAYENPDSALTANDLKGWWPLIEGSGDTAYDWSGNGNHGTIELGTQGNTSYENAWGNADALDSPLVPQTALLEWGMGSNVVPHSNNFSEWTASKVTVDSDSISFLDGSLADKISDDTNDTEHLFYTGYSTIASGSEVETVVYAKAGELDTFAIKKSLYVNILFDLTNETTTDTLGVGSITAVGGGWYRCTATATCSGDISYTYIFLKQTASYIGDGSGMYFWNVAMHETSTEATTITHAQPATNALTPMRSWETAGQFTRDYGELNWNGRSYADAGNGADVNPSTALIVEMVQSPDKWRASTEFPFYKNTIRQYWYSATQTRFRISQASGNTYGTIFDLSGLSHVVLVFDRTTLSAYVNGTLIGAVSSSYPTENISSSSLSFTLGGDSYGGNNVISQIPLLKMIIDDKAQAIIDDDLDAWVAKRYAKAQAKYGL